eukprot:11175657-Heterocapsa_arctica.AAC.1
MARTLARRSCDLDRAAIASVEESHHPPDTRGESRSGNDSMQKALGEAREGRLKVEEYRTNAPLGQERATFILAASTSRTLSRISRPEMKPLWRGEMNCATLGSLRIR